MVNFLKPRHSVAFIYLSLGHCFFLEDGGEKYTTFTGNLGALTRRATLTPGDEEGVSTFWITSPLTDMIGNVAAGCDHTGHWFLFPDDPVALSRPYKWFEFEEARRTPIGEMRDNVAHSNGENGWSFFRRLTDDHGINGCNTYSPRVNPKDQSSEFQPVTITSVTAYKNRERNAMIRMTPVHLEGFRLADSQIGIGLEGNFKSGFLRIHDMVVVGESDNLGTGGVNTVRNDDGEIVERFHTERSLPHPKKPHTRLVGLDVHVEQPLVLDGVKFRTFRANDIRPATAMHWEDFFTYQSSAFSNVKRLDFDWSNGDFKTPYMMMGQEYLGPGDEGLMLRDVDGSLTGKAGVTVGSALDQSYTVRNGCQREPEGWQGWVLCDGFFAKIQYWPERIVKHTLVTDEENEIYAREAFFDPTSQWDYSIQIAYTVKDGDRFVMHFPEGHEDTFEITARGLGT